MIIVVLFIIKDIAHIAHGFDSTIPGRTHEFLFLLQEHNIIDGVIVNRIGFGFAAIDSVEEVDVIIP